MSWMCKNCKVKNPDRMSVCCNCGIVVRGSNLGCIIIVIMTMLLILAIGYHVFQSHDTKKKRLGNPRRAVEERVQGREEE